MCRHSESDTSVSVLISPTLALEKCLLVGLAELGEDQAIQAQRLLITKIGLTGAGIQETTNGIAPELVEMVSKLGVLEAFF